MRLFFDCACRFLCGLFLAPGRQFAVRACRKAFEGFERARADANALSIQTNGLQIHLLLSLARDVGVASGVADVGAFACQRIDAAHRIAEG